jgi:hypothetical protein
VKASLRGKGPSPRGTPLVSAKTQNPVVRTHLYASERQLYELYIFPDY